MRTESALEPNKGRYEGGILPLSGDDQGIQKGRFRSKIRVFTPPVTLWSEIIFGFWRVCSRLIPSRSCRTMILALLPLWFSFDMRVYASEKIKKDGLFIFLRLISDSG